MLIKTTKDLREAVRMGSYAWPGGYPLHFVCSDGESLHPECVKKNYRQVSDAIRNCDPHDSWHVFGIDVNYEDAHLYCAHCHERIESAYAEDEEET